MVAPGDHVDTRGEQVFERLVGDAEPTGRVLAVRDHEVRADLPAQRGEERGDDPPARLPHDVPDEENPHDPLPFRDARVGG